MFDGKLHEQIDPVLDRISGALVKKGITANQITLAGFALGCIAAFLIALGCFITGLVIILISRLCDGLDGAVARKTTTSDFGGYLDIVLDFAFYGLIPLAFAFSNPDQNGLAASVLIFSFYVNGASFLAYATIAEKMQMKTTARGEKSIYFTVGLAEAGETLLFFALICIFPSYFSHLSYIFSLICFVTAISRILQAKSEFIGDESLL